MNILVTGASRGLGLETCRVLLQKGHSVFGVSRTPSEEFSKFAETGKFFFKSVDLSDPLNAKKSIFCPDFLPNTIPLHGFVNNAAAVYDDIITNIDLEKLRGMFDTDVFAPMLLTKYAIRNMIYNRIGGAIVHVSSVSVRAGYKGLSMYAAGKGALEAFSVGTAREWGAKGIRSNVVAPGFMETSMNASLSAERKAKIYARTSLKTPTDINSVAETIAFLLSDAARSVTGQCVGVDAGTL